MSRIRPSSKRTLLGQPDSFNHRWRIAALSCLLLLTTSACIAQNKTKVRLIFDTAATRTAWIGPWPPGDIPKETLESNSTELKGELPIGSPDDKLIVLDRKSGNIMYANPSSNDMTVFSADFKTVYRLGVRVVHAGKPAAVATVVVTNGKDARSQLLTNSDNGTVWFTAIPCGQIKVKVKYRVGEKVQEAPVSIFEIPAKRDTPAPILTVSVSDDIETVATNAATKSGDIASGTPAPVESSSPIGKLVLYLLGIGVAGGVAYGILRYVQKNQKLIEEKLGKMGVSLPGNQPQDDPVPAVMPPAPQPIQQILLDDAVPTSVASVAPTIGNPRLRKADGTTYQIIDGENTIGRDASCTIPLTGEDTLSRRHAMLTRTDGAITLLDLGSTNGTLVNGAPVVSAVILMPGDTLLFGSVRFNFEA